jgi:hypothetical protein
MLQGIRVFGVDLNLEQDRTPSQQSDIDLSEICLVPELALTCGVAMHGTLWPSSVPLALYVEFCQRVSTSSDGAAPTSVVSSGSNVESIHCSDVMNSERWLGPQARLTAHDGGLSVDFRQARVLELGAGTGVCGLVCRRFTDAECVTITDVGAALGLIERNRARLEVPLSDALRIEELFWGEFGERWRSERVDVLVASDVIYETKSHAALLATFAHFWRINPNIVIVLAHRRRYAHEAAFFEALARAGFKKRDILGNVLTKQQRSYYDIDDEYHLFQIWRDAEANDESNEADSAQQR